MPDYKGEQQPDFTKPDWIRTQMSEGANSGRNADRSLIEGKELAARELLSGMEKDPAKPTRRRFRVPAWRWPEG